MFGQDVEKELPEVLAGLPLRLPQRPRNGERDISAFLEQHATPHSIRC
jgi:hypothetical protein